MNGGTIRLAEGSVAKQPIVSTQGVSKRFGANAVLKNVSIAFDSNEVHAICGENGAGKTTLVKILTGIYTADQGTVILDGQALRHTPCAARPRTRHRPCLARAQSGDEPVC